MWWWALSAWAGAPVTAMGDAVSELGDVEVADPFRWLEQVDDRRVVTWREAQHAWAGEWLTEGGLDDERLHDAVEAAFLERRGRLRVEDVRGDTLLAWTLGLPGPDAPPSPRMAIGWNGAEPAPVGPDDQTVCASVLAPGGDALVVGWLDNPGDATPVCSLHRYAAGEAPIEIARVNGYPRISWSPEGDRFLVTARVLGRRYRSEVLEVTRDGELLGRRFVHRGQVEPVWLPDGQVLTLAMPDPRARAARLFHGPPGTLRMLGSPFSPAEASYTVAGTDDGALLLTTDHGAERRRVVRLDPREPQPSRWVDVIPEDPDRDLVSAVRHGDALVVAYRDHHGTAIERVPLDGGPAERLPIPHGRAAWLRDAHDGTIAVIVRTAQGDSVWRVEADGRVREERPAPPDGTRLVEVLAPTDDGTLVPVTLWLPDGPVAPRPLFVHVYGGFEAEPSPWPTPADVVWLRSGGAVAWIHGRGDRGSAAWRVAGPHRSKVFDDVVDAARHLVDEGWTETGRIVLTGGSNGGLTALGAMVRAPELFGAVIGAAGVYDLVRGPHMGDLWWPEEYGVADDPRDRAGVLANDPLLHLPAEHPPVLLGTSLDDPIVPASHAYKAVAALQRTEGVALLRVGPGWGHAPARDRRSPAQRDRDWLASEAEQLAFASRALGFPLRLE